MSNSRPTDADIVAMVSLLKEGLSTRQIRKRLGFDHSTVIKYLARYAKDGGAKTGGPPPDQPVNKIIDRTDIDGSVEMLRMDRPATVEAWRELAGATA